MNLNACQLGLNDQLVRTLKKQMLHVTYLVRQVLRHPAEATAAATSSASLQAGDLVVVRSSEAIQATLSARQELMGCGVWKEMLPYCGTVQQVLKPVQRFVSERDYQVREVEGVVLLKGVMCHGTEAIGPCDRSCYFFWRQEWLEKVETSR
ncbi:MAG TPA: hypothetical protein VMT24_04915 [Aggregatilineaceae bacterium]|nr:hypothetical protein [Aggregatilineaceae bacterium]